MPPTSFRPHGQFKSRIDGRIIVSEITGPWNRELVQAWAAELAPDVSTIGPHVGIAVIHGSMVSTPEAMDLLGKIVRVSAEKYQCLAHLLVAAPGVEGRELLKDAYFKLYEGHVQYGLHDTLDQALAHARAILGPDLRV